jgi:hypothetical protein
MVLPEKRAVSGPKARDSLEPIRQITGMSATDGL